MRHIFLTLVLLFTSAAQAFRLSPMVVHFSPEGSKRTQVLTLENTGTEKIPIQIEAFARSIDNKGQEVRTATSDFVIYPEQLVLLPGEKRNIRATWGGDLGGPQEKSYRFVVSQLPVEFQEKAQNKKTAGANLNFLLQYVASVYVTPSGAKPLIKVKSALMREPKKLELNLANEGTAHLVLRVKSLKIFDGEKMLMSLNKSVELDNTNVLAKTEKSFVINLPEAVKAQNLRVTAEFEESVD